MGLILREEFLIGVARIARIGQTSGGDQLLDLFNPGVNRARRIEAYQMTGPLTAHSVIPSVLKSHFRGFDNQVRIVISHLIRQVDDSHILTMQVVDPGFCALRGGDNGLGHIPNVE